MAAGGTGLAMAVGDELLGGAVSAQRGAPAPAALLLFSPEIDLDLDHPSITDNASHDILPWNVPVTPYLHGVQASDGRVSAVYSEPDGAWFPPTFVCSGGDEMFRDGIRDFVVSLGQAGIDVEAMAITARPWGVRFTPGPPAAGRTPAPG